MNRNEKTITLERQLGIGTPPTVIVIVCHRTRRRSMKTDNTASSRTEVGNQEAFMSEESGISKECDVYLE